MYSLALVLCVLVSSTLGGAVEKQTTPSLYLVGDSTMALHNLSEGIQGWGVELSQFLQDIRVVNRAISGSSARSYTRNGNWKAVKDYLVPGDYVIIEFGHNDGGSPDTSTDADVYGTNNAVTKMVKLPNGAVELVHTFGYYIEAMIDDCTARKATVIISSQTPDNPYDGSTTIIDDPPRFVGYAKDAAAAKGVPYVDHFAAVISLYRDLGKKTVDSYYPFGHTHTNTAGAVQVARAFLSGLRCTGARGVLTKYLNSVGRSIGTRC